MNRRDAPEREVDLEAIAALLHNRLSPAEREALFEQLARSEEAYEIFAEAVGIQEALAAEAASTDAAVTDDAPQMVDPLEPRPMTPRRLIPDRMPLRSFRRHRLLTAGALGATALAAAALVIFVLRPPTRETPRAWRDQIAAFDLSRLPEGWSEPPWPIQRGGSGVAGDSLIDLRTGARVAHLAVAVATDDATALRSTLASTAHLLDGTLGAEPLATDATVLRDRLAAGEPVAALAPDIAALTAHADEFFATSPYYDLGTWAETGRLAALAGARDLALRRPPSTVSSLDLPAPLRTALADLAAAKADPAAADLADVAAAYQLIVATGRLQP